MKGIFVSYSRADQPVARRVRNGLASLGIDVLWDENMPGVDWQEFLEHSINEITAVVVLWTPRSYKSKSVRDEARLGLDKGKLVNILSGVDRPRFPFDRINGLPVENWMAGEPHSGWQRLVATLDARLAAAGAIARPGVFTAALTAQLKDVADRRASLVQLERANARTVREEENAEREVARAEQGVADAQAQLDHVKAISASKSVMAAAFADRDEAAHALTDASTALAFARAAVEQGGDELEQARSNFRAYLVSIGGKADGEADMDPFAYEADADVIDERMDDAIVPPPTADPVPDPVIRAPESTVQPTPQPYERFRPTVEQAPPPPREVPRLPGSPPRQEAELWAALKRAAMQRSVQIAVLVFVVALAVIGIVAALWQGPTSPKPRPPVVEKAPDPTPSPSIAAKAATLPGDWIVGAWSMFSRGQDCVPALSVAHSDNGRQLVFSYGAGSAPDTVDFTVVSNDPPVIETADYRYERRDTRRIKATNRKSGTALEFVKCES